MSNEELVQQIQQGINTAENMATLYADNRGFIASVVKKYGFACQSSHNGVGVIEFDELMNEAYFGLVEAIKRYDPNRVNIDDPEKGYCFLTYAAYWIRQVVKRYIDNCGNVVRVPVHIQARVYKYNQTKAWYLNHYNRVPTPQEYATAIDIPVKEVDRLERFMFKSYIKSLDEALPGGEDGSITLADAVSSGEDIEHDVIEKVAKEELRDELWDIVGQVLKNDKSAIVIRYRFIEGLTLNAISCKMDITREMVRQYEAKGIKRLRCNSRTRRLGMDLGLWHIGEPMNIDRVKRWAIEGRASWLDDKELNYARRRGWVQENVDTGYKYDDSKYSIPDTENGIAVT